VQALDIVAQQLRVGVTLKEATRVLVSRALKRGTLDNVSVIAFVVENQE
jgi:hypothetical protein